MAIDDAALALVVRAGAGSRRDSLSVLDQLAAGSGDEGITYALAASLLGFSEESLIDEVVDAFAAHDAAEMFAAIDRVVETGHDPRRFAEDLLERLRDLLVLESVPDAAELGIVRAPADKLERLRLQAGRFGSAAADPRSRRRQRRARRHEGRGRAAAAARDRLRAGAAARASTKTLAAPTPASTASSAASTSAVDRRADGARAGREARPRCRAAASPPRRRRSARPRRAAPAATPQRSRGAGALDRPHRRRRSPRRRAPPAGRRRARRPPPSSRPDGEPARAAARRQPGSTCRPSGRCGRRSSSGSRSTSGSPGCC